MIFRIALMAMVGLGLLLGGNVFAQEDTVYLEEYTFIGIDYNSYQKGHSISIKIDSMAGNSLTTLLQSQAPVYFQQYGGEGQLSSINLRGLGSSRSSLLWNGIEINSFTLGQSDYNLIDPSIFNNIQLQLGSGSSLYGNGALGGAMELNRLPSFSGVNEIELNQIVGSFGKIDSRVSLTRSSNRVSSFSSFSHKYIENDFKYNFTGQEYRQSGAAYRSINGLQDLHFRVDGQNVLSANIWYLFNDRDIQQAKGDLSEPDHLRDYSIRSSIKWLRTTEKLTSEYQVGYTLDHQIYNQGTPLKINRGFARLEWEKQLFNTNLKFGLNNNFIHVKSANFEQNVTENRNDLFLSVSRRFGKRTEVVINLREPVIDGEFKPFSPSVSGSYSLSENISFNGQLSRSFRIPTINDRFWNPGGNPDLNAELSNNYEVGLSIFEEKKESKVEVSANYFFHDVENWIIWIPGGSDLDENGDVVSFWYPDNLRNVVAQGAEMTASFSKKIGTWNSTLNLNGSYTSSINKVALNQFDRSEGKQLPYTPKIISNASLNLGKKNWAGFLHCNYTGERFIEANNELNPLPSFFLINLGLSHQYVVNDLKLTLSGNVKNLLNKEYENFENRAMPGRGFELQLNIKYYK